MFFFIAFFWNVNLMFFLIFITKNTHADGIPFFDLVNVSNFCWTLYVFKTNFLSSFLSISQIYPGVGSAGFKYLIKIHLNNSLLPIFLILINHFLAWCNPFINFTLMHPGNRLYFEVLIVWSMNQSIIQPEPCPKEFCMFVVIVLYIDLNTSSIFLLLIITSAFEYN